MQHCPLKPGGYSRRYASKCRAAPASPHSLRSSTTQHCGQKKRFNLRKDNVILPPLVRNSASGEWEEPADDWGELRFCSAAKEIGAEWTGTGSRHDQRQLKARARESGGTCPFRHR